MAKTKIAVFVDQLVLGGVQKDAIEEVRTLRKLGYDAELVALMRKGFKGEFQKYIKDIPYKFLSDRYPIPFRYSLKFPIFSFFSTLHVISPFIAPFFIKRNEWSFIIAHGTTTCFTTLSLFKTKSIKYAAVIHDPMEYILKQVYKETILKIFFSILSPLLYIIEKAIVKNAKSVVVVSNVHASFIKKVYKIQPKVIIAGAKPLVKLPKNRQNFLLAVSRWERGKNPFLLLKLLKKLPQASLVVAGSWTHNWEFIHFKEQVKELKLTNRIKIYPLVSDKKLSSLYSQALAWIHPNFEAFGVGGLEAAAHGCPIIIPAGSGITELFEDGKDGFFPQKANLRFFLPAIKKIVSDPQKAYQMGISAFEKAKIYSWGNHTKKLIEIIKESLSTNEKSIVVLETGHSSESYLAGGDKLLEKMAYYFPGDIKLKVILPSIGTKHWQDSKLKNVELIILPQTIFDNHPEPTWIFLAYLARIWHSYLLLRKFKKIDILYSSTNVLPDIAPVFLFRLNHLETPWIARVHHLVASPTKRPGRLIVNIISYIMQAFSSWMIKARSTKILTLNNKLLKTLANQKFPRKKLGVLGAGIDFYKINQARPSKNNQFEGVFIGRIHPTKGISDLVRIWKIVTAKKPDAKAIIIGEGAQDQKRELISKIKKAKLTKNLKLAGFLPENKLNSILKSSKVFLFCDHEAGWGLAIGEAMAAGLPVVGYNLDIFGDVFKKGFLTVPLGNEKLFADKIIYLLTNQKYYQNLKKQSLTQAKQLSWQKTSFKFQQIINDLK